jgi:hypothetical protein
MDLRGTFGGIVEDNKDPEKLGRLKVRVPHIYGAVGGVFGAIATNDLPWALPAGLPNGLSQQSGGMDWLPQVGDQVLVRFLDAEPEKPVWEWFMQTLDGAKNFPLHAYESSSGGSVGAPKRGALVRYGHTVEWNADGLILTTSKGYRVLLTDASDAGNDGDITIQTQAGQFLDLDDSANTVSLNVNEDYNINVANEMLALCDSISLQTMSSDIDLISGNAMSVQTVADLQETIGKNWLMTVVGTTTFDLTGSFALTSAQAVSLTAGANLSLTAVGSLNLAATGAMAINSIGAFSITSPLPMALNFLTLSLGPGISPFVLGDQLLAYLVALTTVLTSHTHSGVFPGPSQTGPMTPSAPVPPPTMLSLFITGK